MRSKISFFNRTVFRKNITHFWPIWAVYALLCIWSMPIYSYFTIRFAENLGNTAAEQAYIRVVQAVEGIQFSMNPWIIFAFSILSAAAVFSYLYNSRSVNMIHALPVRREELFVTNYLSGLLFLLIPQVTAFLLTVFVWFGYGINHLEYLLQWLGIVVLESFFAYSMGVLCCMLTGNIVAVPICFAILNYLYKGIWNVWNLVRQALIYGFAGSTEITYGEGLVPIAYFRKKVQIVYAEGEKMKLPSIEGMGCLKWYALAAILFVAAALVIYKKRQLECAGDIVAISGVKPLIRWAGALLCAGLTGQLIQSTVFYEKILSGDIFVVLILCWITGGILSFYGIQMIMEKNFMIFSKKLLLESAGFLVVVILFLGSMQADLFQMEERVPEADKVAEVYVDGSYSRYITSQEGIQKTIDLQKKIIASREEYQQYFRKYYGKNDCNFIVVNITYVMENGKKQNWSYNLPLDEYYMNEENSAVKELMEQEADAESYMAYYFTEKYGSIELQSGSCIDWIDEDYNFQSMDISKEDSKRLVEAFQADIAEGNYRIYSFGDKEREENTYVNTLTICYKPPKGAHILQYWGWNEDEIISNGKYPEYTGIILTKECKNTIALLEEMGYIDQEHRLVTEKEYQAALDEMDYY